MCYVLIFLKIQADVCLLDHVFIKSYKVKNDSVTDIKTAEIYQNIFPLANTFAKRENVRLGQSPTGTQMVSITALLSGV